MWFEKRFSHTHTPESTTTAFLKTHRTSRCVLVKTHPPKEARATHLFNALVAPRLPSAAARVGCRGHAGAPGSRLRTHPRVLPPYWRRGFSLTLLREPPGQVVFLGASVSRMDGLSSGSLCLSLFVVNHARTWSEAEGHHVDCPLLTCTCASGITFASPAIIPYRCSSTGSTARQCDHHLSTAVA